MSFLIGLNRGLLIGLNWKALHLQIRYFILDFLNVIILSCSMLTEVVYYHWIIQCYLYEMEEDFEILSIHRLIIDQREKIIDG